MNDVNDVVAFFTTAPIELAREASTRASDILGVRELYESKPHTSAPKTEKRRGRPAGSKNVNARRPRTMAAPVSIPDGVRALSDEKDEFDEVEHRAE